MNHSLDARVRSLSPGATGPTIALVHGMAGTWRSWLPLRERFDPSWRVFAFDLPWRSATDVGWRRLGTPAWWIARAVDELGVEPDLIVAHSFGANALLQLLATSPDPPTGAAVLLAPGLLGAPDGPESDQRERVRDLVSATLRQVVSGTDGASSGLEDEPRVMGDIPFGDFWRDCSEPIVELVGNVHRLPLASVGVPVTVLCDPGESGGGAQRLTEALPDAHAVFLDHAGHLPHFSRTDEVLREVVELVDGRACERPRREDRSDPDANVTVDLAIGNAHTYFESLVDLVGHADLGEQALVGWHSANGFAPEVLRHDHRLSMRVVSSSLVIKRFVRAGENAVARVRFGEHGRLAAQVEVTTPDGPAPVSHATYEVVHVGLDGRGADRAPAVPGIPVAEVSALRDRVPGSADIVVPEGGSAEDALAADSPRAFTWSLRVPLYLCSEKKWLSHYGLVEIWRDTDDRFRFDRVVPVAEDARKSLYYPITSLRLRLGPVATADETLYVRYGVKDVYRRRAYDARIEYFVVRDGVLVRVAAGLVTHACAVARPGRPPEVIDLGDDVLRALKCHRLDRGGKPAVPAEHL
ncbi:alpha/beta fold hydrolase [Amycolatopsis alba]|uniref:Alpha/beta hydrolase n=1 Tax=Amycolatopsis alba DSM 44262 TaxID=1125972 RepID=A0A229RL01_AMYAL|nr:alpha/beta hydrolase [Amycolatopsis alba]OXM47346.1 alpha/beta hydrolase [Amycolatopsis alba DSM 44262]